MFSGPVVGGHLGTIRALVGTLWMPDTRGAVLILEEVFVPWVGGRCRADPPAHGRSPRPHPGPGRGRTGGQPPRRRPRRDLR
ncbi:MULTISPECIES: hypothetical protein [Nocardia]|uniref:hypothetical protein n=1 Tax=Nocardia TaxID=1817 RepID=UPI00397F1A53